MSIEPTSTVAVDVLAGHLGHLTQVQQEAFALFQENLAAAQLYSPSKDDSRPSHDEPTLLCVELTFCTYEVLLNRDSRLPMHLGVFCVQDVLTL